MCIYLDVIYFKILFLSFVTVFSHFFATIFYFVLIIKNLNNVFRFYNFYKNIVFKIMHYDLNV